jgi:hypothetical protein
MVTKEKALKEGMLEQETLREMSNYFRHYFTHSSYHPDIDRREFKEVVRLLKYWREKTGISDSYFRSFLMLWLAWHIQSEVEGRFEKAFLRKFESLLNSTAK